MESLVSWLIAHGSLGMFIAAFLSGSILPFSSELVMTGLLMIKADPWQLLIWGTAGNTLGTLVNYGIGHFGKEEWIMRYAKVPPKKLEKGIRRVRRYGAWAGLLSWLPVVGEILTVAMGYMRTNFLLSCFTITLGKFLRYYAIIFIYQSV